MKQFIKLKQKNNKKEMSVIGHTTELKKRIKNILIVFFLAFIFCCFFSDRIMDIVFEIGRDVGYKLVYLAPQELLIQQLRVAFICSFLISLPIILYEIIMFLSPAFEIKYIKLYLILIELISLIMFSIGSYFAYRILFPFTCNYLYGIGINIGITAQISVEKYISLFLTLIVCIGCIFELPLICVIFSKLGIINHKIMKKTRKIVIIIIFIIAAIITPPDVISQMIVAIPMVVLYQISILLCKIFKPKKIKS